MGKIGLLVNYDGHWHGAQFMGSSPFGICVSTEEKHDRLLEKIYRRVGVNRDRFKLKLSTLVNTKTGKKILPILCDGDVEFVLVNTKRTPEVFVEVVERPVAALETVHVHQTPIEAIPMHPTSFSKDAEDKAGEGNGKEAVGNPKPDADKTTFWTYCPSCGIRYQYHRTHVNILLLCQSCQQSFTAYDLGSLEISSAHPCNWSLNQNGVPNPVFQNRFPNPGPSKVPSQSIHGNSSAMAQEKVDGHMKGMEGVRMHKPDVENGKEGVGKPKPDGGKPSECGTSRNADKRMPVGESSKSYEAGNGDEDEDVVLAAQAHLYIIIKVARDKDLAEQIGRDIYFDLVDHGKVRSFRIQKQTPFIAFKEEVAKEFGIPVQFQRFWIWAKRQNHTYRPNRPLLPQEEAQTVGQLRKLSNKTHSGKLKLFLEVEIGPVMLS